MRATSHGEGETPQWLTDESWALLQPPAAGGDRLVYVGVTAGRREAAAR